MEVSVTITNLKEVVEKVHDIPGASRFALQQSIMYALRRGRTVAAKAATERYNVPYRSVLKAIGTPHLNGLIGSLNVSGSRFPLSTFPTREIFPFGVAIQELRTDVALPINLLHAFVRGGRVMERETPATTRYPIMPMVGLSAPAMIAQKSQVFPILEKALQEDVDTELERLVRVILSGDVVPR